MTPREQDILALIRQNPLISQKQLGEKLGISREAVAGYTARLTRKGIIRGKGYLLNDQIDAVVIGGCNLDIHGYPKQKGQTGDSLPGEVTMTPGGVGRNIAENLARLGNTTRMISVVGQDESGKHILQATANAGVDISSVVQHSSHKTSVYLSIVNHNRELIQGINAMTIMETLTPDILSQHLPGLQQSHAVVIDANITELSLNYLFEHLSAHTALFVECVSASKAVKLLPFLQHIHTLKPNRMEAEALWGHPLNTQNDMDNCAKWLHDQGVKHLFISLGDKGLYVSNGTIRGLFPVPKEQRIISVSGAGDALMAGIVHAWLHQDDLAATVAKAQACAALTLEQAATINPELSTTAVEAKAATYINDILKVLDQ